MFPVRQPLKSYAAAYRGDVPQRPLKLPKEGLQNPDDDSPPYVIEQAPAIERTERPRRKGRRTAPLSPLTKSATHLNDKKDAELIALVNARRPSVLLREGTATALGLDPAPDPDVAEKNTSSTLPASTGATPRDLLKGWTGMRTPMHGPGAGNLAVERTPSHRNLYANSAFLSPLDRGQRSRMASSESQKFLLVKPSADVNVAPAPTEKRDLPVTPLQKRTRGLDEIVNVQEEVSPETYKRVSQFATPRRAGGGQPSAENSVRRSLARGTTDDNKAGNIQKKKVERTQRNLQFETDQAFAPFDEKLTAARQEWEAKRKALLVGPHAQWILMPGETPPDDRRNFNQVGMLPPAWLVEDTVRQIKRVFRWCFETPADAFTFFDIGGHYKLSITWLQRGFYRMNMHELWRCPHQDCCRFVCQLPDDHDLHSYILMDERMCLAIMRMAHAIDNTFWKHDFVKFFDFGKDLNQAQLPTCVDVAATSAQTPRMANMLKVQAESGNRTAKASVTRQRVINKGRDWGIREDWRRYARWLGGGNAWRLLHKQCSQLQAQRDRRQAIFHQLCEDIREMTLGDRKMNSKRVAKGEKKLERCVQLVKKTEMRILGTLEQYSLHLIIPKAIEEANGRKVLPAAPDLGNLLEVMLDLVDALMSLTVEERSSILLQKEAPEGEVEGLSLDDSGEGFARLASSSEEDAEAATPLETSQDLSQILDASVEGEDQGKGNVAKSGDPMVV